MVKVAWKVINGYGPYAYLQKSVKAGEKVKSLHVAYLGSPGTGGLIPGKHLNVPQSDEYEGGRLMVPFVPDDTAKALKPGPAGKVSLLKDLVEEGLSATDILAKLEQAKPAKKPAAKKTPAKKTSAPSTWTKVGPQLGSTTGGVYQDPAGAKFYVKCPPSGDHVRNELLARDLYGLAGVRTLGGWEIELDGAPCIAADWAELEGSGTNPKGLEGTLQGFVADAWLANWDSVGVGSTPYDNILSLDGKAVRVDAGGALRYRGTGGLKGDKFGTEVTELEGLRDKKLNPVAATVFGEMTHGQLMESAAPVLAVDLDDVAVAVKKRYPDDPELAQELTAKLAARRNYIKAWLDKQAAEEAAKSVAPDFEEVAPNLAAAVAAPKLSEVPKDNKGKALISAINVKKLEAAAAGGDAEKLEAAAQAIAAKLLHQPKKSAVLNAAAELQGQLQGAAVQEGDDGSGLGDTIGQVDAGAVDLPEQSVPSPAVVAQQTKAIKAGKKNYNADFEQVSGQKGSNAGGLYKDKKLQTLHYVKWPNSPVHAKVEALTGLLYAYAQVPVPTVRAVKFQDKDAVVSDWIDGAEPMTIAEMKKHQDVLDGFAADAWLSNWDVVGLQADNIVKGPGGKAYRIDLGGSMLFRAKGSNKAFPPEVQEIESLRNPSVNPQASQVFEGLTQAQVDASVAKVTGVTDAQIDAAVDSVKLPKKAAAYPVSQFGAEAADLPAMLKSRLKARRDHIAGAHAVGLVSGKPEVTPALVEKLKKSSTLKDAAVEEVAKDAADYKAHSPSSETKWSNLREVVEIELGKKKGASAVKQLRSRYRAWKGSSASPGGAVLRWGAGEARGDGDAELRRVEHFLDFLVKKKSLGKPSRDKFVEDLKKSAKASAALPNGLQVAGKHNRLVFEVQHPGKEALTLYRGWKADQLEYLKLQNLKVGQTLELHDPPIYSWSTDPHTAEGFGHGSAVVKANVPIEHFLMSDLVNSIGSYEGEKEVVFKGVPTLKMEVIKTH